MAKQNTSFAPSLLPTSSKAYQHRAVTPHSSRPYQPKTGKSFHAKTANLPQGMTPSQTRVATNVMHSGPINPIGIYNAIKNNRNDESQNSRNIDRRNFFDDRNSGNVTFGLGLENKLFPITKRVPNNKDSRLHIIHKDFFIGTEMFGVANDEFKAQFTKLRSDVNRQLNNSSQQYFTINNYSDYIKAVFKAVAFYYAVDSIMSYGPKTNSQYNYAIEVCRNALANNDVILTQQNRLRRTLIGHYLPNNLFKLAQKLGQFHRLGQVEESAAFIIDITGIWLKGEGIDTPVFSIAADMDSNYNTIIKNLHDQIISGSYSIAGILSKVRTNWEICDMPLSTNHAQYDPNISAIFTNSINIWSSPKGTGQYPIAQDPLLGFYCLDVPTNQIDGYVEAFLTFDGNRNGIWADKFCGLGTATLEKNKTWLTVLSPDTCEINTSNEAFEYIQRGDTFNCDIGEDGTEKFKFPVVHDGKYRAFIVNKEGSELNTRNVVDLLYGI